MPIRSALGLVGVLFTLVLDPSPGSCQGVLLDARMEVGLPPSPGPPAVAILYRVLPETGVERFPLTLLAPEGVYPDSFSARLGGILLPVELKEAREYFWEGEVSLVPPVGREGGRAGPGGAREPDTLLIGLEYRVPGAWGEGGRVTLPIPAPAWIPSRPGPRTFVARVRIPEGWVVEESFPTSVTERPEGNQGGIFEVSLQGVPSLIILRMAEGAPSPLTLERLLDLLVVGVLLALGFLGIRFVVGGRP